MFTRGKTNAHGNPPNVGEWGELRPGGMLVQKRTINLDANKNSTSSSIIKVKVKYGSSYHQISISSHASFGELKKMLTECTGLHGLDQKLFFKKKERDSKSYLDVERVKDGSKLVLIEDIVSRERRILDKLTIANKDKASKSLTQISLQVDNIAKKVAALEAAAASTGGIIAELDVESLTENLMTILITLDEIHGNEGELKLQRREQVRRVQKHIETLDMLKMPRPSCIKNEDNKNVHCGAEEILMKQQSSTHSESVVVTTEWETFD